MSGTTDEAAIQATAAAQSVSPAAPEKNGAGISDSQDVNVWGSIVAGVAIGLIVGGGLALIFAPRIGGNAGTHLGGAVDDLKDRAEQVLDEIQASASDLAARSRTVLERTRENLAQSVEAGKAAYRQTKEDLTAQLGA